MVEFFIFFGAMEGKHIAIQKHGESSHFLIQEYLIDLVIIAVANN